MTVYVLALLTGMVAGLRTMAAPALVCWAVYLHWLNVSGSWLAFLGNVWVRWIVTLFVLAELVVDQLPTTASGTLPVQFGARILTGAPSGAAIGAGRETLVGGAVAGVVGAVIATLAGHDLRARLAAAFDDDHLAALLEDSAAIGGTLVIGMALR